MDPFLKLLPEIEKDLRNELKKGGKGPFFCDDNTLVYREQGYDNLLFSGSRRDIHRIFSIPYFSRYTDKTQVYSLLANDDITHRSQHVQYVAYIAKTIGSGLLLNTDLIEAIALSHDIGHAPFGHFGERSIDSIMFERSGVHFGHSVQSVRIVDKIFRANLSYEVLVGILAHCGRLFDASGRLSPSETQFPRTAGNGFECLYNVIDEFYTDGKNVIDDLTGNTMEALVVRLSDIIAYIGKDREDAEKLGLKINFSKNYSSSALIKYFVTDIVNSSYKQPYLAMSPEVYAELEKIRSENFEKIYTSADFTNINGSVIFPIFEKMFDKFLNDLVKKNYDSEIFRHHIRYIEKFARGSELKIDIENYSRVNEPEGRCLIVSDYISSMSDDYFVTIAKKYFSSDAAKLNFIDYFDKSGKKGAKK